MTFKSDSDKYSTLELENILERLIHCEIIDPNELVTLYPNHLNSNLISDAQDDNPFEGKKQNFDEITKQIVLTLK